MVLYCLAFVLPCADVVGEVPTVWPLRSPFHRETCMHLETPSAGGMLMKVPWWWLLLVFVQQIRSHSLSDGPHCHTHTLVRACMPPLLIIARRPTLCHAVCGCESLVKERACLVHVLTRSSMGAKHLSRLATNLSRKVDAGGVRPVYTSNGYKGARPFKNATPVQRYDRSLGVRLFRSFYVLKGTLEHDPLCWQEGEETI